MENIIYKPVICNKINCVKVISNLVAPHENCSCPMIFLDRISNQDNKD